MLLPLRSLLVALFCLLQNKPRNGVVISASADTYGDFQYSVLNDGTIAITKYTGKTENLTIPAYINGKQVTSIGNRAFYSNRKLESIKIPNGVKKSKTTHLKIVIYSKM